MTDFVAAPYSDVSSLRPIGNWKSEDEDRLWNFRVSIDVEGD